MEGGSTNVFPCVVAGSIEGLRWRCLSENEELNESSKDEDD